MLHQTRLLASFLSFIFRFFFFSFRILFHNSHSLPALSAAAAAAAFVPVKFLSQLNRQLHDLRTLRLFISGRDKKTSSSMSRSSSGYESSRLPSPECPVVLKTLISTRKLQSKPAHPPCISPSPRPPKNSLTLLSLAKSLVPVRAIARSQSCPELRRNPAPGLLRRSFSVTARHERRFINPKNWKPTPAAKTESAQHAANPQKHCEDMSLFNTDTGHAFAPKQAETTQSTHLQLPPTAPAERSNHPLITPSTANPRREPALTQTACLYGHTDSVLSEDSRTRSISATFEARRLKMKRKTPMSSGNLSSLIEERL